MRSFPSIQGQPEAAAVPKVLAPATMIKPTAAARPAQVPTPVRKSKPAKAAHATASRKSLPDLDRVARRLEAEWRTALRKHEAAVHRQFNDLRAAFHKRKSLTSKDVVRLRKALEPRLKPKKGRAKDLRRVEAALGDALASLE
jgi:seryl-tRNA synthetase